MNRRGASVKQLEAIVKDFNTQYPVGSKVMLRKDSGWIQTAVQHEGYVMGTHSAVAHFEGVSGAYCIEDRIKPVGVPA